MISLTHTRANAATWIGNQVLATLTNRKRPVKLFLKINYFWLCWVFVAVCRLSVVAASRGHSLVVVHRLPIAVASLVVEHGLQSAWASVISVLRLSSCGANPGSTPSHLVHHLINPVPPVNTPHAHKQREMAPN